MRFGNSKKNRGQVINVTSLIDVLFLLVIFLMVSTEFKTEGGIAVDLPQGKSKEVPLNSTYTLTIMHDGTMFLQQQKVADDLQLAQAIRKQRETMKDPTLIIEADKSVSWERIVIVTDTAKLSGQSRVNFKIKE